MSDQPTTQPQPWREWKAQHKHWAWVLSPEWASEWIVYWSRDWEIMKALDLAGKFGIVVAVFFYFAQAGDRQKAKHYRAWDLINFARGSTGDGGRRPALEDLNQDQVSLAAAPLSKAYLFEVQLPAAQLQAADLAGAILSKANLSKANLSNANLLEANLAEAHLTG